MVCEKSGNSKLLSCGNEKQNLTALFSVGANGGIIKPFILLPYKERIPKDVADSIPEYFEYSHSTGWMTQSLFLYWIEHVSSKFAEKQYFF